MEESTISLSDGESFTMTVTPSLCSSYSDYELIELEILAVRKAFNIATDMVDESMLAFPTSVQIYTNKEFATHFKDQSACTVNLVHKKDHFGYVARLKYAERLDMR